MISIDKTYNRKVIFTQKGDVVEIQLEENPTTGYLWKINSFDEQHLSYMENKYNNLGNAIGAGGLRTFYFKILDEATSELHFSLGNPWEKDTIDSFNVIFERNC